MTENFPESPGKDSAARSKSTEEIHRQIIQASYQGPLPPSSEFVRYEEAAPGAGNRILIMAETEQKHRHEIEKEQVRLVEIDQKADRSQVKRGQIFGLMVSLSAILAGCVMAVVGSIYESTAGTIMGGIVGGGGLASIIVAFTLQRGSEGEDSNNKGADDSGDV